ncbi:MAG: hypothetical protein V3T31_00330, partial [candidate division Zixibacteria bacterium]
MSSMSHSKLTVIFALLLVLTASIATAATIMGTIVLKSGDRIEDVEFKVDKLYKVLKFKQGNEKRNISFDKIESILDPEGEDITAEVMGGIYESGNHGTVSQKSDSYKKATKPRWSVAVSPLVGYSLLAGNYYSGLDGSLGFGGAICITVTHKFGIRLGAGKVGMKSGDELFLVSLDPDISILSQDYSWSTWRYYAAVQLNSFTSREKEKFSMYYFYSGIGAVS